MANLASGFGSWLAVIALQVDVYDRTHSGWWVGALLMVSVLPSVFLGIALGPLVDRFSRKRLMVGADVGRLAVFAALPFTTSATQVVVLAAVAGVGNALFRPALLAGLPNLVGAAELPAANALLKTLEEPPPATYIILVSDQWGRLPATIVSRCRVLEQFAENKCLQHRTEADAVMRNLPRAHASQNRLQSRIDELQLRSLHNPLESIVRPNLYSFEQIHLLKNANVGTGCLLIQAYLPA